MTDHEQERPLTRRERRLQQMADTGLTPVITAESVAENVVHDAPVEGEIYIAPVDEQGRPRTRREMRELREAALAEREAANPQSAGDGDGAGASEIDVAAEGVEADAEAEVEVDAVEAPESVDPSGVEPDEPVVAEAEESASLATAEEGDAFDASLAETQAFDLQDLVEAEIVPGDAASGDAGAQAESLFAETEATEASPDPIDISAVFAGEAGADFVTEVAAGEAEVDAKPVDSTATQAYTFPDIAPLDDNISVFDDPAVRTVAPSAQAPRQSSEGGFDDLISRAVAQEGAASATNTSALILPAMPEGSDLSGPIGETGELFITGSIELPRSLGETGGHSALLDSVEGDPLDDLGVSDRQVVADASIAPVSAARAVSARAVPGPVVTEAQKEKSKLPIVLIATGGGLVVAVAALLIWGATSGMFG